MKHTQKATTPLTDLELQHSISITKCELIAFKKLIQGHDFLSKYSDYQLASRKWHGQQRDFYSRNLAQRKLLLIELLAQAKDRNLSI